MAKKVFWQVRLEPIAEFMSPNFRTEKAALKFLNQMLGLYKAQGYYSSPMSGRVPYAMLVGKVVQV